MPVLSIIVPCLNEAVSIALTLESLQDLRSRDSEVIVVDGGSSDDSVSLAQPLADRVVVAARGRAAQMNAGAALARGDVILFVHADSVVPPRADRLILEGLALTNKRWGRFDVRLGGGGMMLAVVAAAMNLRSRLTGIATGDQGLFVARGLFVACGGFPKICLMEDIALCQRLKRDSRPLCLRNRITTSARRWQRNGIVRTILLMWWLRLAYFCGADPAVLALRYDSSRQPR